MIDSSSSSGLESESLFQQELAQANQTIELLQQQTGEKLIQKGEEYKKEIQLLSKDLIKSKEEAKKYKQAVEVFKRHKLEVESQLQKELTEVKAQLKEAQSIANNKVNHIVSHEINKSLNRFNGVP